MVIHERLWAAVTAPISAISTNLQIATRTPTLSSNTLLGNVTQLFSASPFTSILKPVSDFINPILNPSSTYVGVKTATTQVTTEKDTWMTWVLIIVVVIIIILLLLYLIRKLRKRKR